MQRFVILGIQRTGTTLIRTAIGSHHDVLCLGEIFNLFNPGLANYRSVRNKGVQELWSKDDIRYSSYLSRKFSRRVANIFMRDKVVRGYLDWLYKQDGYSAVGFKFMHSHLKRYPSVAAYIKENNIRVIHVVRKNTLRTLLSHITKEVRKVAHSGQPVEQVRIELPTEGLVSRLNQMWNDSNEWKRLFKATVPYLEVSYEAFVNDRAAESKKIIAFLELEGEFELESRLVKLNTASLKEIIRNYTEVQECLRGTAYEACLYE